jgi:multidrug efflux pump subunit AcrA (membrane-fusion protein)
MMKRYNVLSAALVAMTLLTTQLPMSAQTTNSTTKSKSVKQTKPKKETPTETQLREMREALKAQQDQIDALRAQLSSKSSDATAAQQTAADAQAQAAAAAASAAQAQTAATAAATKADAASSSVTELQATTTTLNDNVIANQRKVEAEIESPATLHYKGVNITPGGFAAFEGVYRQHSTNSDVNTPFNSIPMPSANEGHVSELNFSGRQSRLSVLVSGDAGTYKLTGYWEMDFLGTGTSSNNNQSNSYVMRQRQIWGQFATPGGFTITGGQMWSLATEDGRGEDPRTEIQPLTIDSQYLVGYTWTRQPEIRVEQRFGNYNTSAVTLAASAEQAQITNFTAAGPIPTEFFFGGIGQNGGLYNAAGNIGNGNTAGTGAISTYANNVAPDIILKAAFDAPKVHAEIGGIGRFLRNEYFPVLTVAGTAAAPVYTYSPIMRTSTATAGGIFFSVRVKPIPLVEVAFQGLAGTGTGRYGSSQLADATLKPNETLEPIRNDHGLFSLILHPSKNWDYFAYYGGEYDQRTVYAITTPTGLAPIGYGPRNLNDSGCYNLPPISGNASGTAGSISASNCASPTRYIQEAMGGFVWRAINSPKYGRLQYEATYSYLQRNLWSGNNVPATGPITGPTGPRATDPMIHVSMRYFIP